MVSAPDCFARHPTPRHPRELVEHECLAWHPTPEAPPYRWEFTEGGRDFSVAVPARVLTTDPVMNVRLARAGAGVTMAREDRVRDAIAGGERARARGANVSARWATLREAGPWAQGTFAGC